jgi:putative ABC transport system substrate-binding protein
VEAFRSGLNESGFVEGQNVAIEYRWAERQMDRLPQLAADLVGRQVDVLVATGGANMAAMSAIKNIPIVASFGADPAKLGFVASLNRPGGNVTGMTVFSAELEAKRLQLLDEIAPRGTILGYVFDPKTDAGEMERQAIEAAGRTAGRKVLFAEVSTDGDLEGAFTKLVEAQVGGVVMASNPLFNNIRDHVLTLTGRYSLPVVYEIREFVRAGGLMSYGANIPDVYRQIGIYTGRILRGEKPADLPVLQPTKFDMAINLRVAKKLGLDVPTSILLRADEVIE